MALPRNLRVFLEVLLVICVVIALGTGIALGIALGSTRNLQITGQIGETQLALPSQILDRNGKLITEYFAEEKRNIISINEVPRHLIYAVIAAEDKNFFSHNGFDLSGFFRALWNNLRGTYFSGASSITQQVAGELYADRSEITIKRKLVELWYAYQMEHKLTKYQILELYLNTVYLGHNTHGIEAASQFYFGHSVRELTLAESAILVVQVRSPARYSMINHPNDAKERQWTVLEQMIKQGYVTREEAKASFDVFWERYDVTRSNTSTAYFENESRAPYFSEYVRLEIEDILYGSLVDINREGFVIHTTLDLDIQQTAERQMSRGTREINQKYQMDTAERLEEADRLFLPLVDALALLLDIDRLHIADSKQRRDAQRYFNANLSPVLIATALLIGSDTMVDLTDLALRQAESTTKRTTVEGALITLENATGHILAMVGGSEFKTKNFNRAVSATVQPGSAFKPLYYSAAVSSRIITPATMIMDSPVIFFNPDGTPYEPKNFLGTWSGPVRARYALANSMNVPSTKVLDAIGFDMAINRASRLLGMYDQRNDEKLFPRKYPLALGVVSVAPINMARAFATFPNQGREVEPIAIRYIEDRKGNIRYEYEKEKIKERQRRSEEELQIMTPQEAYIMVSMLESTVQYGTLANRRIMVGGFDGMPMAGKTGTTDNWANAWTIGFSPYMTTAVWFGFDMPGESLGRNQTGATAAGPIWAWYMKEIHTDLPPKEFIRPETGLIERKVCAVSGKLLTNACNEGSIDEIFLAGTQPEQFCDYHIAKEKRNEKIVTRIKDRLFLGGVTTGLGIDLQTEDFDLLGSDEPDSPRRTTGTQAGNPLLD
ncbi:MAG: PBP1A family penicillin-binding protein [Spirochaetales bacterium]|nr:PBP1A family penicillin-binding protein [Spirochaetales bacterium]